MIQELGQMASDGAQDLIARRDMGILDLADEQGFIDTVCEVAAEHIPAPADKSVDSFSILVGAMIAGYVAALTMEKLDRERAEAGE